MPSAFPYPCLREALIRQEHLLPLSLSSRLIPGRNTSIGPPSVSPSLPPHRREMSTSGTPPSSARRPQPGRRILFANVPHRTPIRASSTAGPTVIDLTHSSPPAGGQTASPPVRQTWDHYWEMRQAKDSVEGVSAEGEGGEDQFVINEGESTTARRKHSTEYSTTSTGAFHPSAPRRTNEPTPATTSNLLDQMSALTLSPSPTASSAAPPTDHPPCPQFTYHLSPAAIAHAHTKRPKVFLSAALYRGPSAQTITIHYCRTFETAEQIARLFLNEPVLGFDIEFSSNLTPASGPRARVSLVQIASETRIALFHLALFRPRPKTARSIDGRPQEDLLPPTLKRIIGDPKILKTGVSVGSDMTRIHTCQATTLPAGIFELSYLHNLLEHVAAGRCPVTERVPLLLKKLSDQCQLHLGLPLDKDPDVRTSSWSVPLTRLQVMYAADDAYASLRLFEALERKRLALRPVPERPGTVAKVYRLPTVLKGELERVVWMPAAAAAAAGPLGRSTVVGPVREAVGAGFDRAEGTIGLSTQDAAP